MAVKFIQEALKAPGALRATAKRLGVLKEGETLSATDLDELEARARKTGNKKLLRRVLFARTLKKVRK